MTREAITRKQERAFLEFVKGDKHFSRYYNGIYILFKTGLRISEFVGLTLDRAEIGGRCGFLYLDKDNKPMVALHWEHYFKHICQKYNSIYKVQMPKVTPHICRHIFCSNMAKSGMNPKTLQYLMGHSDIGVTLHTYTHLGFEDAQAELERAASGG